jgi:hypothetical protein
MTLPKDGKIIHSHKEPNICWPIECIRTAEHRDDKDSLKKLLMNNNINRWGRNAEYLMSAWTGPVTGKLLQLGFRDIITTMMNYPGNKHNRYTIEPAPLIFRLKKVAKWDEQNQRHYWCKPHSHYVCPHCKDQ